MKQEELIGKPVMLMLLSTTASGEDDWAIISGTIELRGQDLHFHSGSDIAFALPEDTLERIQHATPELKAREGVDFYLPLRVGPLPEGADEATGFVRTGLKWPKDEQIECEQTPAGDVLKAAPEE